MTRLLSITAALALAVAFVPTVHAQAVPAENMNFFLTSTGPGNGADLGGLDGADAWCAHLAYGVGQGDKAWSAYLSQQATGGMEAISARDRIGTGLGTTSMGP